MKRLDYLPLALTGLVALATPAAVFAQAETAAGSASRGRSVNERVSTEATIPPPANSDYRRAAEGTLPVVPGAVGIPAGAAIDPAALPLGARNNPIAPAIGVTGTLNGTLTPAVGAALPPGLDTAMLIEHALGMGINSSLLSSLAASNSPDEAGNDSVKSLMQAAEDQMRDCRDLMTKAAAAGSTLGAESPVRRFYQAANDYMKTLENLSAPGMMGLANNKADLAAVNNAVKDTLDASHIAQFSGAGGSSPALDALLTHTRLMKDTAGKTLDRIGGTNPIDPSAPLSSMNLAQKGRDLIAAADALAPMAAQAYGAAGGMPGYPRNGLNPSMNVGPGPSPGQLQNNNAGILGGTYGVGSPSENVATGAEAARNVKNSTELPDGVLKVPTPTGAPGTGPSGYGVGNNNTPPTNSSGGLNPR